MLKAESVRIEEALGLGKKVGRHRSIQVFKLHETEVIPANSELTQFAAVGLDERRAIFIYRKVDADVVLLEGNACSILQSGKMPPASNRCHDPQFVFFADHPGADRLPRTRDEISANIEECGYMPAGLDSTISAGNLAVSLSRARQVSVTAPGASSSLHPNFSIVRCWESQRN